MDIISQDERIEDPVFRTAVYLLDSGDASELQLYLNEHPDLVHQRIKYDPDGYFSNPSLLEFIAENPIRHEKMPGNILEITQLILEAGAKEDTGQVSYTLAFVASGEVSRKSGLQLPLLDLLCAYGAQPNAGMRPALTHGEFAAVQHLIGLGATVDTPTAAAMGSFEIFEKLLPGADEDSRQLALAYAAQFGHADILEVLLAAGQNPNRYNPAGAHAHATPLHQAVCYGHEEAVRVLIKYGADMTIKDTLFDATPLGWAEYFQQVSIYEYLKSLGAQ